MIKNDWFEQIILFFRNEEKRFNRKPTPNRQMITARKLHFPSPANRFESGKSFFDRENMLKKKNPTKKKNQACRTERFHWWKEKSSEKKKTLNKKERAKALYEPIMKRLGFSKEVWSSNTNIRIAASVGIKKRHFSCIGWFFCMSAIINEWFFVAYST